MHQHLGWYFINDLGELICHERWRQLFECLANDNSKRRLLLLPCAADGPPFELGWSQLVRPLYAASGAALRRVFDLFDADGNGTIDRSELQVMLRIRYDQERSPLDGAIL